MTNSEPHQSEMGKREFRQMLTAILRASAHVSGGPSSVSDQDFARMSAPISPPPARKWGSAMMPRQAYPNPSRAIPVVITQPHSFEFRSEEEGNCSHHDGVDQDELA